MCLTGSVPDASEWRRSGRIMRRRRQEEGERRTESRGRGEEEGRRGVKAPRGETEDVGAHWSFVFFLK